MNVILFDIDGTLVRTGGAGKAAMEDALRDAFGVAEIVDTVPYSGRTDRAIGLDLLTAHGVDPTPDNQDRLHRGYLERLPEALKRYRGEVCPGVGDLIADLHPRDGVVLGLLTGNVRAGARHKLGHFGLWDYFHFGGFGDEHYDRDDVARSALAEVQRHAGRQVDPASVWVVGDTPLDVRCARAIGAKAVAVATGWHPLDELTAAEADVTLEDLSDLPRVLALWGY